MTRFNIGIVGLNFGRSIIEQIVNGPAKSYFRLLAVCDIKAALADKVAAEYGVLSYHSLESLLENKDIPVIGLFTGPAGRAELVREIIHAGKHVITTKPFELSADAAMRVLTEAKWMGRVVHMNSPSPEPSADLRQIEKWRHEYNIGRPVACRADIWCSYREQPDGSWYDDPEKCPAAPIFRLGIYLINDLVRLFGEAEEVYVMQTRLFTKRPTADNAQLSILFRNGALANVFASFCVSDGQAFRNFVTLNFENATIYRHAGPPLPGYAQGVTELQLIAGSSTNISTAVNDQSGNYQWRALHRAIEGKPLTNEVTTEQIVAGIRIIEAMVASQKSGCAEKV